MLAPLFGMLNRADNSVCLLDSAPHRLPPKLLGMLALHADPVPAQLRPDGEPLVLMRLGRRIDRLDGCAVLAAPSGGVRPRACGRRAAAAVT